MKKKPQRFSPPSLPEQPTLPRTWSHRVGPPGNLGSNRTEYGENRWSPAVRELRPDVFCGRSERQSVTCVLEPGGLRNELSFKDGDLGCDRRKSPAVSLHRFKYVLGSRVGEQFPVFEINGEMYHLYHASHVSSEVLDPGDCPEPTRPSSLLGDVRSVFVLPELKWPTVSEDMLPRMPLPPRSPAITKHYMPGMNAMTWRLRPSTASFRPQASASCVRRPPSRRRPGRTTSSVPRSRKFEEAKVEAEVVEKPPWNLNASIWAPRRFKEHAKSYLNTQKLNKNCLNKDWELLKTLARFNNFIDDYGGEAEEEMIKTVLLAHYDTFVAAYDYYCATGGGNNPFSMSQNAFYSFVGDCEFVDEGRFTLAESGMIFIKVNLEEGDKKTQLNQINDDKFLMRHEFVEALLRIAGAAAPSARPNLAAPLTVSLPPLERRGEVSAGGRDERAGKTLEGVDPPCRSAAHLKKTSCRACLPRRRSDRT